MKNLLSILCLIIPICGFCQDVYIGDTINTIHIDSIIDVNPIKNENVRFEETFFSITFDKTEIIKDLENKLQLEEIPADFIPHQKKVIGHLKGNEEFFFQNIWSDWLNNTDQTFYSSWDEMTIDKLTIHFLLERVCNQIESGKIKLKMNGENVSRIYSTYISSDYGGYATGYITDKKILFWICPPFVIE